MQVKEYKGKAYAKINLSIDVGGKTSEGYHMVDMIMHQIEMHDDVTVRWIPAEDKPAGDIAIKVTTNRYYLPTDERNLAYKVAMLMAKTYAPTECGGNIEIEIFKRIPVAAGLAGGSSNGAAVLIAMSSLWKLRLTTDELCRLGAELGSDVPFCVMGQRGTATCARALGTGTILEPLRRLKMNLVLVKPPMGVSTREVYAGIDDCPIEARPDNDTLIKDMARRDYPAIYGNMINVLECYSINKYPEIAKVKALLEDTNPQKALMSGSGPTVFGIYRSEVEAKRACKKMREYKYESNWTRTI